MLIADLQLLPTISSQDMKECCNFTPFLGADKKKKRIQEPVAPPHPPSFSTTITLHGQDIHESHLMDKEKVQGQV
jgi:hypothetical protein